MTEAGQGTEGRTAAADRFAAAVAALRRVLEGWARESDAPVHAAALERLCVELDEEVAAVRRGEAVDDRWSGVSMARFVADSGGPWHLPDHPVHRALADVDAARREAGADAALSAAVLAYVGHDRDSAVPGRHPDRVADDALRARVLDRVRDADRVAAAGARAGESLAALAERLDVGIRGRSPMLTPDAVRALVALQTWELR